LLITKEGEVTVTTRLETLMFSPDGPRSRKGTGRGKEKGGRQKGWCRQKETFAQVLSSEKREKASQVVLWVARPKDQV